VLCLQDPDAYKRKWREVWLEDFLNNKLFKLNNKIYFETNKVSYKKIVKTLQIGSVTLIY